jgi:hypothetical protein
VKNPLVGRGKPRAKRSASWPKVRKAHLADNPVCRACGGDKNLEVHHIAPFHLHPELELDPHNLITLCERASRNCHFVFGHFFDWQKFNPNVRNEVTQFDHERRAAKTHGVSVL